VVAGSNAVFTISVAGTPTLCYQWRCNGTNIAGATACSVTLTNLQADCAGLYSVRVVNGFGWVVSSNALLTVNHIPVAQCADRIVSAGAACQAAASIDNGSFDPDGDPLTFSQWPPGPYPLGTNGVTLTVTDSHGASNSCSALVIVVDTTPPAIVCPAPLMVEFQDGSGAVVSFVVSASDLCSAVSLAVAPASGSRFPIGVTPVLALATDATGNSNQCAFTVTVLGAQGGQSNVLAQLVVLRAGGNLNQAFALKFDDAIQHLANSLNKAYWIDQTHLASKGGNTAMNEAKLAVNTLGDIMSSKDCPVDPGVLQGLIDRIVKSARLLAVISIREAAAAGLNPKKVAEDLAMVAKGDAEADNGHYANAIEHYRNALRHAVHLRLQVGLNPNRTTLVQFVGNNSKSYRIEMSTDLVNWVPLGTCTADGEGNFEFTVANGASQPFRFYRVVEQ